MGYGVEGGLRTASREYPCADCSTPIHTGELHATNTTFRWGTTVDRRSDFSTHRRHLGCAGIHTVEDGQAYGGSAQSMRKLEDLLPPRQRRAPPPAPVGIDPVVVLVGAAAVIVVGVVLWLLMRRKKSAT